MSIVVQCPHCGTRSNLPADLNGKTVRCPNLECRKSFTVKALLEKAPPAPEPVELPPEPEPAPKPTKPKGAPAKPKPPKPKPALIEAEVAYEEVPPEPGQPKEVVWSEGAGLPPAPPLPGDPPAERPKPKPAKAADESDVELPLVRRKKKKKGNRGPLVLIGMVVALVVVGGATAFYLFGISVKKEEQLAEKAKAHYDKAEYADAGKAYEQLVKEYADSKKIDEYKFFADLSQMQTTVRSVTNRDKYEGAVARLNEFVAAHKGDPLAKPGSGFGRDVLDAGKKLGEDIAGHAEDRVKAYRGDRAKNGGELPRAEKAVADGRALVPVLDGFRGPDDGPLDKLAAAFDAVERAVKRERDRTAALDRARTQLDAPTDAVIQTVEGELAQAGFLDDSEAQGLIAAAKGKLRELVRYENDPAEAQPPPPTAAASLLFVTPVGKGKPRVPGATEGPPGAFLCVARGILYALDDDTGALLWAARVGPDVTDPPAVARVPLATGPTDLAVVASGVGGAPALAAHELRTGAVRWYQPLPAPAAGPALVVGGRAFVTLRDPLGTVYEFDLATGARLGRIRLAQPVAERGGTLRPGTNLLYVPADARRLYVIDCGGKDDDGNRVAPRCAQVTATGHLPGTVRVPPVFVGPEGTEPAERFLVLCQAEGTERTLLRAYRVEPLAPAAGGAAVTETAAAPVASLPVPGWVAFPPVTDGERLAVATDTGHVRLFGVNQPGNADKALFPLPAPPPVPGPDRPVPALLLPVEEATYWALVSGRLQKARLALVPSKGQEVVFAGAPLEAGEPVHAAQLNARRDTACAVVRSLNSSGVRAVAFDPRDGEVRWQRQLGFVPARAAAGEPAAPPVAQGDVLVLVDEDGGVLAVPRAAGATAGQTVPARPEWVLSAAPAGATGPTVVAAAADGKVVFAVTPVARDGPKFLVRRVADGKLVYESDAPAPAALAGRPAVVGDGLLVPTADGFVNRFVPGDGRVRPGQLVAGPAWLGERRPARPVCAIAPLSGTAFATSDGGKRLTRWDWPAAPNARWNQTATWELRQEVAGPAVPLPPEAPDGPPRLLVADAGGGVWLFAADRAGAQLRRWGTGTVLPAGRPSAAPALHPGDPARPVVAVAIDGRAVAAIDPARDEPLWGVRPAGEATAVVGAPQPAAGGNWLVTDLSGRALVLDGATGRVVEAKPVGLQGAVPAGPAGVSGATALAPLTDGSVVVLELPK